VVAEDAFYKKQQEVQEQGYSDGTRNILEKMQNTPEKTRTLDPQIRIAWIGR